MMITITSKDLNRSFGHRPGVGNDDWFTVGSAAATEFDYSIGFINILHSRDLSASGVIFDGTIMDRGEMYLAVYLGSAVFECVERAFFAPGTTAITFMASFVAPWGNAEAVGMDAFQECRVNFGRVDF